MMSNNMDDEFTESFEPFEDPSEAPQKPSVKQGLKEAWRTKPILKLLVIMAVVIISLTVVLAATSGKREAPVTQLARAPELREVPGGTATPFFIEQNDAANEARARQALTQGGSAMPTPVGRQVENPKDIKADPLREFREETERLRTQRTEQDQKIRELERQLATPRPATQAQVQPQQRQQQQQQPPDNTLAQAMQKQMQALLKGWEPTHARFVKGAKSGLEDTATGKTQQISGTPPPGWSSLKYGGAKIIVAAGTVNYIQLLNEANSDVPGPILAQILSGPFSGGRAIGTFQVMENHLVMTFRSVAWNGSEYSINALALDPDTTLGGMATEVDNRYFMRVVLPAAAAFVSEFGTILGETRTTTTAQDGVIFSEQTKRGYKEALYSGLGSVGQSVAGFLRSEASRTRKMVRVAVGTPMGLFFLQSVMDPRDPDTLQQPPPPNDLTIPTPQTSSSYQTQPYQDNMATQDGQLSREQLNQIMANMPSSRPVNAMPMNAPYQQ